MTNDEQRGPAVAALAYASPLIEKSSRSIYQTVIVLGAAPMVVGALVLLTCWAMRWGWGADYTILLIVGSAGLVLAAGVALAFFFFRERRFKRLTPVALRSKLMLALLLLACNVPAVALYTIAPRKLTRRTTLTVINNGPTTINRFLVNHAGGTTDIGPVAPGATASGTFYVPMNSWLSYEEYRITPNSTSGSGAGLARKSAHTITIGGNSATSIK